MADQGRAMMGSKADMIGSKFDEVARNQIWREHLKKEARLPVATSQFVINPKTMKPVSGKPGTLVARDDVVASTDSEFSALTRTLKAAQEVPKEKTRFPRTATEEIGWYTEHAVPEKFANSRPKCTETKYAESYVRMAGTSPYAKTG